MTRRPWLALALLAGACASRDRHHRRGVVDQHRRPARRRSAAGHVGTGVAGEPRFVVNDGGVVKPYAEVHEPFRYFVRPDGDLAAIGDLKFAAAITRGTSRPTRSSRSRLARPAVRCGSSTARSAW
jgi:hypothetical protein